MKVNKESERLVSQSYLKSLISYSPDTGLFTNLVRRHTAKKGCNCGFITSAGYVEISIKGNYYKAHRLAWLYMTGKWPEDQIDHINRVRNDNKWSNLRESNNTQNKMNSGVYKNNSSGLKGVTWDNRSGKWRA